MPVIRKTHVINPDKPQRYLCGTWRYSRAMEAAYISPAPTCAGCAARV